MGGRGDLLPNAQNGAIDFDVRLVAVNFGVSVDDYEAARNRSGSSAFYYTQLAAPGGIPLVSSAARPTQPDQATPEVAR